VDGQLNAKLADLELGSDSRIEQAEDESPFQKDFLANWIPPEVPPSSFTHYPTYHLTQHFPHRLSVVKLILKLLMSTPLPWFFGKSSLARSHSMIRWPFLLLLFLLLLQLLCSQRLPRTSLSKASLVMTQQQQEEELMPLGTMVTLVKALTATPMATIGSNLTPHLVSPLVNKSSVALGLRFLLVLLSMLRSFAWDGAWIVTIAQVLQVRLSISVCLL
jgi:hypothetical protein